MHGHPSSFGRPVQPQSTLRDYLAVLRRRKWLLIASVIALTAAAGAYSYSRTPLYRSTVSLAYERQSDPTGSIGQYYSYVDVEREMKTAAKIIQGPGMGDKAAALLGAGSSPDIPGSVSAESMADTNLLVIRAVADSPTKAKTIADAYARVFVDWRIAVVRKQLSDAAAVLEQRLKEFSTPESRALDPGTYYSLAGQLSALDTAKALTNGNYRVVEVASAPTAPFSPDHVFDLAVGLLAGLVVGLGLVLLAEQLDVRVRAETDFGDALELSVLGRLPQIPRNVIKGGELVALDDPESPSAEAFRMLRGNLDFVAVDADVRSILVTSCTPAEGKTSTVCNLAVTLTRANKRVVVVEADLRRPKIHSYFNVDSEVGLSSVIAGRLSLEQALRAVRIPKPGVDAGGNGTGETGLLQGEADLWVLTSGPIPPNPGEIVTSERMSAIIAALRDRADVVLIDSPPFLAVGDAAALAPKVDGLLLVLKQGVVTKAMLSDTVDFLRPLPCRKLGLVLTDAHFDGASHRYRYYRQRRPTQTTRTGQPQEEPTAALPQPQSPA